MYLLIVNLILLERFIARCGFLIFKGFSSSSLIAECEEYCKTDEFTKDFSDHLVHLFSHNRTNSSKLTSDNKNIHENKNISTSAEVVKENSCKPPKIPDNLRTKNINKSEKSERCGKFPVSMRSSTYDNVVHTNDDVEDEGYNFIG